MPMGGGKIIIIIKKVCTLIWARETERHDEGVMQERLKKKKKKRKEMFREWGETVKCRGKKFGMWSLKLSRKVCLMLVETLAYISMTQHCWHIDWITGKLFYLYIWY